MSLCDFVVDISGEEASSSEEDAEDAVDDVNFVEPEVLAEISVLAGALPVDSAVAAAIGTRACVPLRALFASLLSAGMGGTRIVNEEPAHECRKHAGPEREGEEPGRPRYVVRRDAAAASTSCAPASRSAAYIFAKES